MITTCCINKNPVMIYSGQEFGKRMDEEGLGKNGELQFLITGLCDTLRRWNNEEVGTTSYLQAKRSN